jgi:membrane associated rhomboid family serine protease
VLIPDSRALEASNSVTGIIFAAIVLLLGDERLLLRCPRPHSCATVRRRLYRPLDLFDAAGGGHISHEAHLAGAVSGLLLAGLLAPGGFGPLLHRIQNLLT